MTRKSAPVGLHSYSYILSYTEFVSLKVSRHVPNHITGTWAEYEPFSASFLRGSAEEWNPVYNAAAIHEEIQREPGMEPWGPSMVKWGYHGVIIIIIMIMRMVEFPFHGLAQETVPIRVIQVPTAIHMSMPHHKAQEDPGDV